MFSLHHCVGQEHNFNTPVTLFFIIITLNISMYSGEIYVLKETEGNIYI